MSEQKKYKDMNTLPKIPRRMALLLLAALLIPQLLRAQQTTKPQGEGTADDPYEIATAEELLWFKDYINNSSLLEDAFRACAVLTQDIDMTGIDWTPICADSQKDYQGTFDGQGHTIFNLSIQTGYAHCGLFGRTLDATIQHIAFNSPKVINSFNYNTGVVVGYAQSTTLKDIKVNGGMVQSTRLYQMYNGGLHVGGIVGHCVQSEIRACTSSASISGMECCGGIVGRSEQSTIADCANHGTIKYVDYVESKYFGGIVGLSIGCTLQNVLSTGNVSSADPISSGLIVGSTVAVNTSGNSTADGIWAYSTTATVNETLTHQPIGNKARLTVGDGKELAQVLQGFTAEQFRSGYVTWLLNGSRPKDTETDNDLAWYQHLGSDDFPLLETHKAYIVYHATLCEDLTPLYTNDPTIISPDGKRHNIQRRDRVEGIYDWACLLCGYQTTTTQYIKDFYGQGIDLPITQATDGTYTALEPVALTDATIYNSPVDFEAEELTYTRSFTNNEWQPLYVPFDLPTSKLPESVEVAVLNNFHEYKENGKQGVELEVKRIVDGSIVKALTPCVIRNRHAQQLELKLTAVSLGEAKERSIDCWSMKRHYVFTGTCAGRDAFDPTQHFVMKNGALHRAAATAHLRPQRWYLTATDITGSTTSMPARIAIKVAADDATAIDALHVVSDDALPAADPTAIYDLQGRRLMHEPTHGVYIKDGKKHVR